MRLQRILVMTDSSDASRWAFLPAAALGSRFGAEVHLVHYLDAVPVALYFSPVGIQAYSPPEDCDGDCQDLMDRDAADPIFNGLSVKTHLFEGEDLRHSLPRLQRRLRTDLTVISTRGKKGSARTSLGALAEAVAGLSIAPVLLYPPPASSVAGRGGFEPRRILVPFDFSKHARAALDLVRFFARAYGARTRFLLPVEPLAGPPSLESGRTSEGMVDLPWSEAYEEANRDLCLFIHEELRAPGQVSVATQVGSPFVDILKAAGSFEAELVIMAMNGWNGLRRLFPGTVVSAGDQEERFPVLILPGPALQARDPEALGSEGPLSEDFHGSGGERPPTSRPRRAPGEPA